jgi:hypothetical protein
MGTSNERLTTEPLRGARAMGLLAALSAAACGATVRRGGFDVDFPSNVRSDLAAVIDASGSDEPVLDGATLVTTARPPDRGFSVFDLPSGQLRFQIRDEIDARPIVVGSLVLSHAGRELIGWDARTGRERFRRHDHGFSLTGAGGDGRSVAITLGPGGVNRRAGYLLVLDPRDGRVLLEREVPHSLGSPTARGDFALVPWDGQYLSVFDVRRNLEHARLLSADDVFARARAERGAVFYGGRAMYRLEPESAAGRRDPDRVLRVPREDLPGTPPLTLDGYEGLGVQRNARERVAVIARSDPAGRHAATTDELVYSLFHRVVFAINARDGAVRWGYLHDADVAGAEAVRGGLVLVDEDGHLVHLDATRGNVRWRHRVQGPVLQGILGLPIEFAPPSEGGDPPRSAADTLLAAAGGTDTRLLPAREFAVRALARMSGEEATRALLDVASRGSFPQDLRRIAGQALAARTDGTPLLLEALEVHRDRVRGIEAPPVGFIAQALGRSRTSGAVAPLLRHLNDPETPADDLPHITAALRATDDRGALAGMLEFLQLFHADDGLVPQVDGAEAINDRSISDQEAIVRAMEHCVLALAAGGDGGDRRWLQAMADDPNTVEPLRPILRRALGADPASRAAEASAPRETPEIEDPNIPPTHLSMARIAAAFEPRRESMLECLQGLSSVPAQVRITFRFDDEGRISSPTVTPGELSACIVPLVLTVTLPRSQTSRDIGTYYLVGAVR